MEKLSKTAKVLDVIFGFAGYAVIVVYGFGVIAYFFMAVVGDAVNALPINLGNIIVNVKPDFQPTDGTAYMLLKILPLFMFAINGVGTYLLIRIIRNILAPMINKLPFSHSVSKDLRKFGIIMLTFGFLSEALSAIYEIVQVAAYSTVEIINREVVEWVDITSGFSLEFATTALIVFMLSFIFRYGEELQKQSDETL